MSESANPDQEPIWFMSFAGPDGSQGVTLVRAKDFDEAAERAFALGVQKPVQGIGFPLTDEMLRKFPTTWLGRLVPPEEVLKCPGMIRAGDLEPEKLDKLNELFEDLDEPPRKPN